MGKNVIEVVLQPEAKKESILLLLFKKKRFILFVTLIGLVIGLIASPIYYLRTSKLASEISNTEQPPIISDNLFDREFLTQSTREREPGNLHISKQLRYDSFLVNETMNDISIALLKKNDAEEQKTFGNFYNLAIRKLNSFYDSTQNVSIFINIDDYVAKYPYLLINDDKNSLRAKIRENQFVIDNYNLAVNNATNSPSSAQIFVDIELLNRANEAMEQIIEGNITNDPDSRGTQIAADQIDALCKTLDEVKLELLTIIDNYTSPVTITVTSNAPSLFNVVAIGAIFPCMMFMAAILLVLLLDWWHNFMEEQENAKKSKIP